MAIISMFYGIVVAMFCEDTDRHHLPHIHVRYSGEKTVVSIADGALLAGHFPARQLKMVQV